VVASWGPPGPYKVPKFYRSHYWAQAVLLLDMVNNGELSEERYRKMVGWRADPSLVKQFKPKMLFWGGGSKPHASNHLVTATDSPNDQVKAMQRMEFIVTMHSRITPTARFADIILPAMDWMWEERTLTRSWYGGFESVNFCPGVVPPKGEVKPWIWVYTKLAERLSIHPRDYFKYYTSDANWDHDYDTYLKIVINRSSITGKLVGRRFLPGRLCVQWNSLTAMNWKESLTGCFDTFLEEGNP
jgi:anaerobic selenocysteine-containing dehydrogenase